MPRSEAINPKAITLIAYAHFSFPLTYVMILGALYNLPLGKMLAIGFSVYYLIHTLIAIFTGWALYHMRPYAWHIFVFHCLILSGEQFYLALSQAENFYPQIPLAVSLGLILLTFFIVKWELRVPYFNPRIAWWESDPRYKISVPAQMTSQDHFYQGEIMDISANGCFIKSKAPIHVDQIIHVKFALFDSTFSCDGKIVWQTEGAVTHPRGVGVRFLNLDNKNQLLLRDTVKKLKSLSLKYKNLRKEEKVSSIERKVETLLAGRKNIRG